MVYEDETIKAKCIDKTGGKFIKVFSETDQNVVSIAEFLDEYKLGYYRKAVSDYPIKAVRKGLSYQCPSDLIKEKLKELYFNIISVKQMVSKKEGRPLSLFLKHKSPKIKWARNYSS